MINNPGKPSSDEISEMLERIEESSIQAAAKTGCLSAKERLASLFDQDTFAELQKFVTRGRTEFDSACTSEFEGVICGYGSVGGKLVFAFSQDMFRMKGAIDRAHAEKICSLYELALKNGAPVVGLFDSSGASVGEGVSALDGYGRIMKRISQASGIIPQIAVIAGVCGGCSAAIASMFDFVIISGDKGKLFVNSPFLTGKDSTSRSYVSSHGLAGIICEDEAGSLSKARDLISLLPSNNAEGTVYSGIDDSNTRNNELEYSGDMRKFVLSLSDDGQITEISGSFAPEMVTALVRIGGTVLGVVANDRSSEDGVLSMRAAQKAARFYNICDSFNIPVLTLVDTAGTDVSGASDDSEYASSLGKLASVLSSSENPKVTVVMGEAYGTAFTLMASRSLGADIVYASFDARIGFMNAASAVEFVWNGKIASAEDPKAERQRLESEWAGSLLSPVEAASRGLVDDIVRTGDLKTVVCSAFEILNAKSDGPFFRRHQNYPI